MIVWDADDFGSNHVISGMCQAHDCRDQLDKFHIANPNFKATLFTIPGEMTPELYKWCLYNQSWIELAVHGFFHTSNYECEKITYEEFDELMGAFADVMPFYQKIFKAPGWQISDDAFKWLLDNGWSVADQSYNNDRRPEELPVYIVGDNSMHHHTWDCVGNGVYEQEDYILDRIKDEIEFKFVSEAMA